MKNFDCREAPIQVFGLPCFESELTFARVPEKIRQQIPSLSYLGRRSPGGRVCFRTDSPTVRIRLRLEAARPDPCIPYVGASAADVYIGPRPVSKFMGGVTGGGYTEQPTTAERIFEKANTMEEVTVLLPRNELVLGLEVGIEEGAQLAAPTPYRYPKPVLFYGSSITEGGCASRVGDAYTALLSRWLDTDYINYGFSGSAKGEPEMARLIAGMDMSVFVYDYDHNAPDVAHLQKTHKPFFDIIRAQNPELPVIMMSRPNFEYGDDAEERRACIWATYDAARKAGDRNVYFIDGETFFGTEDRGSCTVDTTHPNSLGFYRMAKTIYPVLREILERQTALEST